MRPAPIGLWSCLWILQLGGLALAQPTASVDPAGEATRPDPARFAQAMQAFERHDQLAPPAKHAILFTGSSSIRLWDLQRWLPGYPVINRGFGGSVMNDALHFADRIVTKYKPRLIIVYAGDNDIAGGLTAEQVAGDFSEFVHRVRQQLPAVRLVYISIKPSLARWEMYPRMADANELIRKLAEADSAIEFLDIATPMLGEDGRPRAELFVDDGLHLNENGYRLWTDRIRPLLGD